MTTWRAHDDVADTLDSDYELAAYGYGEELPGRSVHGLKTGD